MRHFLLPFLIITTFVVAYLIRFYTFGYSFQEGQNIRITGRLLEDPVVIEGRQKLNLGQVRAYVDQFPEYHYPDEITVEGETAKGKGGWYLKNAEVSEVSPHFAEASTDAKAMVDKSRGKEVSNVLLYIRKKILETYGQTLPEPQSGLLKGIILGTKNSLDSGFLDNLRNSGTLHIVVASGGNIAIFAGSLLGILSIFFSRRRAVLLIIAVIWTYVFLVGWQPPIVRAAIMGTIAFSAQALGREAFAWRALFVSGAFLLFLNPFWIQDVGFQLSFLATAGILAFGGFFTKLLKGIKYIPALVKESLSISLAAQIAVSPILLFTFHQPLKTWLIAPFANVLVLWTLPFIMAGGAIMAVLGFIWQPLAQIAAYFVFLPLTYFVKVVEILGSI